MDTLPAPYFVVTENILDALGVELELGRAFHQGDYDERLVNSELEDQTTSQHYNVILSRPMADAMYPDGDALGKQIQSGEGERVNTIVGIMTNMHNSWPGWDKKDHVMLIPGRPEHHSTNATRNRATLPALGMNFMTGSRSLIPASRPGPGDTTAPPA